MQLRLPVVRLGKRGAQLRAEARRYIANIDNRVRKPADLGGDGDRAVTHGAKLVSPQAQIVRE